MATSEGPSSPQRMDNQPEFVRPPGWNAMGLREQLDVLGVPHKHMKGDCRYEIDRCLRVARNKALIEAGPCTSSRICTAAV